jgi:putative hydrolase of the HAD superfamily
MRPRGLVFDLDETLYRERRFALSGYRAVAGVVEQEFGVRRGEAFGVLALALRRGRRSLAFQDLSDRYALPSSCIASWLAVYRAHVPAIRLRPSLNATLEALRSTWRTAVLTNGLPGVQAAKVHALGLDRLVDVVVYADEFGGKPGPEAFLEVVARLGTEPMRTVMAGDDEANDIEGARRLGMKTVLVDRRRRDSAQRTAMRADATVRVAEEVPAAAERLISGERAHGH